MDIFFGIVFIMNLVVVSVDRYVVIIVLYLYFYVMILWRVLFILCFVWIYVVVVFSLWFLDKNWIWIGGY